MIDDCGVRLRSASFDPESVPTKAAVCCGVSALIANMADKTAGIGYMIAIFLFSIARI